MRKRDLKIDEVVLNFSIYVFIIFRNRLIIRKSREDLSLGFQGLERSSYFWGVLFVSSISLLVFSKDIVFLFFFFVHCSFPIGSFSTSRLPIHRINLCPQVEWILRSENAWFMATISSPKSSTSVRYPSTFPYRMTYSLILTCVCVCFLLFY